MTKNTVSRIFFVLFLCSLASIAIAGPDAARIAGDLKVDGLHFSTDGSVLRKLSDATGPQGIPGPPGASPWTLNGQIVSLATGYSVGIGTAVPGEALDVVGNIRASGTISGNGSGLTVLDASNL